MTRIREEEEDDMHQRDHTFVLLLCSVVVNF